MSLSGWLTQQHSDRQLRGLWSEVALGGGSLRCGGTTLTDSKALGAVVTAGECVQQRAPTSDSGGVRQVLRAGARQASGLTTT